MYGKFNSGTISDMVSKSIDYFKQMQPYYGKAVLKIAYAKIQNELKPYWAKIEVLYKDEEMQPKDVPVKYDYGDLVIVSHILTSNDVLTLLESIRDNKIGTTPDGIQLKIEDNAESHFLYSKVSHGYIHHPWPGNYLVMNLPRVIFDQNLILGKKGLPYFPDAYTAVNKFLELNYTLSQSMSVSQIVISLPDYRARISNVVISGKKVSVIIENKAVAPKQLIGKVYIGDAGMRSYQSDDLRFDESKTVSCEVDFEPDIVSVCILDESDNMIDGRDINLRWIDYTQGTKVESPVYQIEELLKRGENENVEFKVKPGDEFLETIASFANTSGGTILLGVEDSGRAIGYDEDIGKLRDKITNRISSNIDPPQIKFQLQRIELEDENIEEDRKKVIMMITVFKGENRPYSLRDRGILVRRGATDRWIARADLDEIYADKNKGNQPGYPYSIM